MTARSAEIKIRRLRADELKEMKRVWERSGLPYRPRGRDSMRNLRKEQEEDPERFLGAFLGGRLVGVSLVTDDGRKGWINRLAVVPEARGRGIAKRLIRESENILRRRGRRLFCVLIESYNAESMKLFEEAGYRREDEILYFAKRELESY